jgi:hypothetical protein
MAIKVSDGSSFTNADPYYWSGSDFKKFDSAHVWDGSGFVKVWSASQPVVFDKSNSKEKVNSNISEMQWEHEVSGNCLLVGFHAEIVANLDDMEVFYAGYPLDLVSTVGGGSSSSRSLTVWGLQDPPTGLDEIEIRDFQLAQNAIGISASYHNVTSIQELGTLSKAANSIENDIPSKENHKVVQWVTGFINNPSVSHNLRSQVTKGKGFSLQDAQGADQVTMSVDGHTNGKPTVFSSFVELS